MQNIAKGGIFSTCTTSPVITSNHEVFFHPKSVPGTKIANSTAYMPVTFMNNFRRYRDTVDDYVLRFKNLPVSDKCISISKKQAIIFAT